MLAASVRSMEQASGSDAIEKPASRVRLRIKSIWAGCRRFRRSFMDVGFEVTVALEGELVWHQ